ncbi:MULTISPECIES: drug/metabolite exporter YedA [Luteimonas]|uniref:Drug/metabolite transporter (DMT)-like permease n=1 Tax=Luteimonas terrae TaxID=1530191 RepID=A0ABU1XXC7_9GAMM|nr:MULTISPECIES: drug/metabolite exporter YedA [Luteimonas]MCD9124196.1 drug/metabolite exporter YedA [Luteimonas fraxinea]MDR7193424.1 drug/metabolite transporter (DMT)-like permease [Luteimonas terrae]
MSVAPVSRPASVLAIALALAAVYLVWGSTYLAIRFALEGGYPPLLMAGMRFIVAGGLMYAALRLRGVPAPTRNQWKTLLAMGVLLLGLGNGMVCIAEQSVSSGLAAVAVASAPIWIALFAAIRGDRPSRIEWAGLAVGFAGVLWLNAGSSLTATPTGLIALLIAPLAWAFGSVWSRGRDLPSPFMAAAAQMLAGGVIILAVGLLIGERFHELPTLKGTLSVAYLASFGSIIGFTAYVWLLHNVRPTLAGSYAYVNPAIAVLLGAWLASERFHVNDLGAMAVILVAVVAITLGRARAKKPVPTPAAAVAGEDP